MTKLLRIFVSSPGDVPAERLRTDLIIDRLAQEYSRFFRIESYRWEHEPMLASGHFQDAIEPPSKFDIVVLIVWSRLGTHLPAVTNARSYEGIDGRVPVTGTEWEYEDALRAARERGAPDILAFRNVSPALIDSNDPDRRTKSIAQLDALDAFWRRHFADRGLFIAAYDEYRTIEAFSDRLYSSLDKLIQQRLKSEPKFSGAPIWAGPPFRGLAAYEFEHADIFFGRDALVAKAAEQLASNARAGTAFLLVSGASGSGKSSLVKAALLPRLMKPQRITGAAFVRRAVFRPSDAEGDILQGLAEALVRGLAKDGVGLPELLGPGQTSEQLAAHLRSSAEAPGFVFSGALGRLTEAGRREGRLLPFEEAKLILVIDQLEEIFTIAEISDQDRLTFTQLLKGLAQSGAVWVVATIRSDFWHRTAETPQLMDLAEAAGRIDVAAPSPAELTEMIRKPALAAGLSFEIHQDSNLSLDVVLAEHAAAAPGVLPLLSFTLDQLYEHDVRKEGSRTLTFTTYHALGNLEGAIATRADEVVNDLPAPVQTAFPRVLRILTTVSAGTNTLTVARSVPVDSFSPGSPARALVDALIAARLVVASLEGRTPTVRLAHEALVSRWTRAADQLAIDRRDLETRQLIEHQEARWLAAKGRAQRQLLLRDPDLANAIDLNFRWTDELSPSTRSFIQASRVRAKLRQRMTAIAAAAFALVAIGAVYAAQQALQQRELARERSAEALEAKGRAETASLAALKSAEDAKTNERRAIFGAIRAQRSESLTVAEQSLRETNRGNATAGMQQALLALPKNLSDPERPFVTRAKFALAKAVLSDRLETLLTAGGRINHAIYTPDGSRIATASRDGVAAVLGSSNGEELKRYSESRKAVYRIAFSNDGKSMALAYEDPPSIVVRDALTGAVLWDLRTTERVSQLYFLPNSEQLISIGQSGDTKPRVWDLKTGRQTRILENNFRPLMKWSTINADGKYLSVASWPLGGGGFSVWDVETGATILSSSQRDIGTALGLEKDEEIRWGEFVKDTNQIALRGTRSVYFYDAKSHELHHRWKYADERVSSLDQTAISSDGTTISFAVSDTDIATFDVVSGRRLHSLVGHTSKITHIAISRDGAFLAATAADHTIRIWNLSTGREALFLRSPTDLLNGIAFSNDGTRLLTYGNDGAAVWDLRSDQERLAVTMPGPTWQIRLVSPAGTHAILERAVQEDDSSDIDAIGVWNISEQRFVRMLDGFRLYRGSRRPAFSPSGKRIVLAYDLSSGDNSASEVQGERARLTDAAKQKGADLNGAHDAAFEIIDTVSGTTDRVILTTELSPGNSEFAWNADESLIGISSYRYGDTKAERTSSAEIWDVVSQARILRIEQAGTNPKIFFSPDKQNVSMVTSNEHDGITSAWRIADGKKLSEISGYFDANDFQFAGTASTAVIVSEKAAPRLVDMTTGNEVGSIAGQYLGINDAWISADGQHLLIDREGAPISLWHLARQNLTAHLPSQDATNTAGQFSGDSNRVLTNRWHDRNYRSLEVFDASTGSLIKSFGTIKDLNFAYLGWSGKHVVTLVDYRNISIFDVDGAAAARRITSTNPIRYWRLSADDTRLVTTDRFGRLEVWDTRSGEAIVKLDNVDRETPFGDVPGRSAQLVVLTADGRAVVLDSISGKAILETRLGQNISSASLSPDAKTLVAGSSSQIDIYDIRTGLPTKSVPVQGPRSWRAHFSGNGETVFIHVKDGTSVLLDLRNRKQVVEVRDVKSVAAAEGSNTLVLAHGPVIEVRNILDGAIRHQIVFPKDVDLIHLDKSGALLAVTTYDSVVSSIDTSNGEKRTLAQLRLRPTWLRAVDKSKVLYFEPSGLLSLRDSRNGNLLTLFADDWPKKSDLRWQVALDPSRKFVGVRSPDKLLRFYRTSNGESASFFLWDRKASSKLGFAPSGNTALVLSEDGAAALWNVETGKTEKFFSLPGKFTTYTNEGMGLNPIGSQFVVPDKDGRINIVSIARREVRSIFSGTPEADTIAAQSPDGSWLATLSRAGILRIWQLNLSEVLLECSVSWKDSSPSGLKVRFSSDSRFLIIETNYEDSKIFRLPPSHDELANLARGRLSRLPTTISEASTQSGTAPRFGVMMSVISHDRAAALSLNTTEGAFIMEVIPGSPAMEAGIRMGDVVVEFDGQRVRSPDELRSAVTAVSAPRRISLLVIRGGKAIQAMATLEK